ncbi:MAG: ATP-binding protein [Cellvibrionaceae bacterium]|nr:ATP-binding protein [Cellvibrionaceae bacterium]
MLCVALTLGQTTGAREIPADLAFGHILPDQLESIGYMTAIVQDNVGFLWFGGANGLARYDGYNLVFYKHQEGVAGSLSNSYVNHLLVTRDGSLWVATQAGLNRYDADTDSFVTYLHDSDSAYGTSVNDGRQLLEDRQGRMWLGTRGGFHQFFRESGKFTRYFYDLFPKDGGDAMVWSLEEDRQGHIWIGNHTGGLSRFDPELNSFTHYRQDPADPHSISHNDVRTLFIDSRDRLWVGTYGGGLNMLPPGEQKFQRYPFDSGLKNDVVWDVLEDREGNLWIGDGGALTVMDMETGQTNRFAYKEGDSRGLGNHLVNTLFEDRAGDLWLGFFPSGVDMVDRQASVFRNFTFSPNDPSSVGDGGILATYEDVRGNIWIGTGYGLSLFDRATASFKTYRRDPLNPNSMGGETVLSIAGEADGRLWLGIWSAGLHRFDPATEMFRQYLPVPGDPTSLLGREPWAVLVDRAGVLWVATEEGVNRYNRETDDFTHFVPHPSQMDGDTALYTRALYEDSHGNLWVGSIRGLYLLDRKTGEFERFRHRPGSRNSISSDFVKAIFEDSRGYLWIGTHGGGLNRMEITARRFHVYHTDQGLPDDVVTGIVEDDQRYLWVSTHKGIARFDPESGTFRAFDKSHGLVGNLFNRNTPSKTSRGELLFGSSKGLTLFKPEDLRDNNYVPPVVITDFQIFNKPVPIGTSGSPLAKAPGRVDTIHLNPDQSVFSFAYAALNYRSPEENQYAYRLEGFDKTWHYVGQKRTATYTNLDPGTYTFRVRGSNNERRWNEEGTQVRVIVAPPLWRSWGAYTAYALMLAGLLYLALHFQMKKQAFEREHTLNQRLQELDKLKDEFLANTSHELRTPLNGIIGLSESLLDGAAGPVPDAMKKYLEMIAYSGKRLANLVNDILDFSKLKNHTLQLHRRPVDVHECVQILLKMTEPLVGTKDLELINAVPETLPSVLADEGRLQQILYNLVGNAVKFTDQGSVTVSAKHEYDQVVIDVVDTGIGIPPDQVSKIFESFEQVDGTDNRRHGGTGLGLAITKRLVELHGGTIGVCSTPGVGSRFRVKFPVAQ